MKDTRINAENLRIDPDVYHMAFKDLMSKKKLRFEIESD